MAKITYVRADGREEIVDVPPGTSLMQAAVGSGIAEIVAECGGNLMCATCHVYVDPAVKDKLPEPGPDEDAMLDCVATERETNSRLSCQLVVGEETPNFVVRLPETQY